MKTNKPWRQLFWEKVNKFDGCWLWSGAVNSSGYGCFGCQTSASFRSIGEIKAHRVSWTLEHGAIPAGVHVLHTCDNPPCVRPSHLWLGSNKDNAEDRDAKGRGNYTRGEAFNRSSLTDSLVVYMRSLYAKGNWTHAELAEVFDVDVSTVSDIIKRRSWKHI